MGQSNYVHLEDCTILKKTDKAVLIRYDGEQHWLPLSQVADADDLHEQTSGITVSITEWIAEQKNIDASE